MTLSEQILIELRGIKQAVLAAQTDYALTDEACKILGFKSQYDLTLLRKRFMSPDDFAKRGRYFVYKKHALVKLAYRLDKGEISV